jgi:acyl-CoA synthetase (AMP-forming)/AMP-acid ligase II
LWIPTGDLVERVGERCVFVGRMNDLINVGGEKVQPLRVEQVIQGISGVRDARVFARSSSLVGQMVACEFVAEPGFDPGEVKARIEQICRERLTTAARPRFVDAVPQISLTSAGKKCRNVSS